MAINEQAKQKLLAATFNSGTVIETLEQMADIQRILGGGGDMELTVGWKPDDVVEDGDLIPSITFHLREVDTLEIAMEVKKE
jgi:hypothetical protein